MALPQRPGEIRVRDIMSTELVTLEQQQSLPLADALMKMARVRHLPVVDGDGRLVGLVTHRDILKAQLSEMSPLSPSERSSQQLPIPIGQLMESAVWTIEPDALALTAAHTLKDHRYGCLPVVEHGKLVGIVTEADFLALLTDSLSLGEPPPKPLVQHVMSKSLLTLGRTATLGEARSLMRSAGVRHVPIIDDAGKPLGIISDRDLRVAEAVAGGLDEAEHITIALVGTEPLFTVFQDSPLGPTLLDMAARRVGSALVTSSDGFLVGILTTTDVCRSFGEDLQSRV